MGSRLIGLGHIYRALTVAKELSENNIIFVIDKSNEILLNNLISNKIKTYSFIKSKIIKGIISLKPDLVINDILSTTKKDVIELKNKNIKVVSFEDLGNGSKHTDLTINEIYDKPLNNNLNTLWGTDYFFLRNEFETVNQNKFNKNVKNVLISFGGSDQHNLSLKSYNLIKDICKKQKIRIHIVTGPAYMFLKSIRDGTFNDDNVEIHNSTGIISKIMAQCDIAISSNGRTIFELAHMNIPTIVIPQHKRESTHSFSSSKNGFILLRVYNKDFKDEEISKNFKKLTKNYLFRYKMYKKMMNYNFILNKYKAINKINELLKK